MGSSVVPLDVVISDVCEYSISVISFENDLDFLNPMDLYIFVVTSCSDSVVNSVDSSLTVDVKVELGISKDEGSSTDSRSSMVPDVTSSIVEDVEVEGSISDG